MNNLSLLTTLGTGVLASFLLFFLFYKVLRWNNKLAALLTILIVQLVYVPLAVIYWAGIDVFAIHFAFFAMSGYGLGIITSHHANRERLDARLGRAADGKQGWFHWGPATIVVFFLILATVDGVIITLANKGASSDFMARFLPEPRGGGEISSAFPGPVPHDFKQKYEQFNNHLAQLEVQRERGWQVVTNGWQPAPEVGRPAVFSIQVTDKEGQPVSGAQVEVSFLRPSDKRLDKHFTLAEGSAGAYGQQVQLDAPGAWTVLLVIRRGEDVHEVKGQMQVAAAS